MSERREKFETSSGIELPNDFNPDNTKPVNVGEDLGEPGEFPYTRGVRSNMYRGKFWTMRQYAGFATAAESNERYKYLLLQGTTGLSVAFDLPTQIGLDSDDELSLGEVGKVGVAIDSLDDMLTLFDGIPLDTVSTSMTINATASTLLCLYLAVARKQGVSFDRVSGTIQNDILCSRGAELEYDLDLGLSHSRGRFDCRAGTCIHAGRCDLLRSGGDRCWIES